MGRLPIFEETVAACASEQRRGELRRTVQPPRPSPRPSPRPREARPHEWAVPATVIRIVSGDCLLVEADLGWRQRMQTYVHLYSVIAKADGKAKDYIASVLTPGDVVTVVSHQMLEPCGDNPLVLASVTLSDGRDLSTLLLGRDLVKPGRVD